MKRKPLNRSEKWCLAATLLCVALVVAAPIWWRIHNAPIEVWIPETKLPTPNAYDDYALASIQIRNKNELEAAVSNYGTGLSLKPLPVTPKKDIVVTETFAPLPKRQILQREYSIAEKTWLVSQNQAALLSIQSGLKHRCAQPPNMALFFGGTARPGFRYLFNLLTLRAQLQAQRGDVDGALKTLLDEAQVSIGLMNDASTAAIALRGDERFATTELQKLLPQLNARQTRQALRRLETLDAQRPTYVQLLQQEKRNTQRALLQMFQDPKWRIPFAQSMVDNRSEWKDRAQIVQLNMTSERSILNNYIEYMDVVVARVQKPFTKTEAPPFSADIVTSNLMNESVRLRGDYCRTQALTSLLLTSLALRSYQLEHGSFPTNLKALMPRYLRQIPLDPFADQRPLRYALKPLRYISDIRRIPTGRLVANRDYYPRAPSSTPRKVAETKPQFEYSIMPYTLYSVGADAKDDKGQPIENKAMRDSARFRYFIDFDKSGDIVAGINTR